MIYKSFRQLFLISVFLCLHIREGSSSEASEDYYCPSYRECDSCPGDWIYPDIRRTGVETVFGTCDVIFYWDWEYKQIPGNNPQLVFNCEYRNGNPCSLGAKNICGSCQNNTLPGIDFNLTPKIEYSDSCGNVAEFFITEPCEGITISPVTTFTTSVHQSSDDPENTKDTSIYTSKIPLTTSENSKHTDKTTLDNSVTVSEPPEGTTNSPECPPFTECSGCPLDWEPVFTLKGTPQDSGLCDFKISWNWDYNTGSVDNPSLDFICIYAANGEYCQVPKSSCASCKTITFEGLDLSLNPYINYLDTCSNEKQIYLGDNCGEVTSPPIPTTSQIHESSIANTGSYSTSSSGNCPNFSQCEGCPGSFDPYITQKGEIIAPDNCTVDFYWDWPYSIDDTNARMVFLCIYADDVHCQPLDELVCASCQKFTISNIKPSGNPTFHYSDTCGNIITYPLTYDCTNN